MNKTVIYLRISTKEQNVETQRQVVIQYCKRNEFEIQKEYTDVGVSGIKDTRPELDALLQDMRHGKFRVVVVYKLDRLGRSLRHLIDVLAEFKNKGVRLISINDNLDTFNDSPMNKAFWQLLGVFSELEREIIVERVKAGLARVKREGKQLGRPKGSKDRRQRSISGYLMRYRGKSKEERKLGSRLLSR